MLFRFAKAVEDVQKGLRVLCARLEIVERQTRVECWRTYALGIYAGF